MKVFKILLMISINCLTNWGIDSMNKFFCIVGICSVVGAVSASAVYLLSNKKNKGCRTNYDFKDHNNENMTTGNELSTNVTFTQDKPWFDDVKSSAIESMYSRHEDAAIAISDSIEEIRENIKVSESTNDEINEVSAELDKMLSED